MKRHPPQDLKGRTIWFWHDRGGFRSGRVLRVHAGPRRGFVAVTVRAVDGRTLKLTGCETTSERVIEQPASRHGEQR